MNPYLFPDGVTSDQEYEETKSKVFEYVRSAPADEVGDFGQTLLCLAIRLGLLTGGETLALELLDRGADPNLPSPYYILGSVVRCSRSTDTRHSIALVKKLVEKGLILNQIYEVTDKYEPVQGQVTLLDYLYAQQKKVSPKRKRLNALADKYAGGLGQVRALLDEAIAVLEAHGAKRASDLMEGS